jgi:hypothetical protein
LRFVYYESIKREVKIKPIYECRCDGRLQTKRFTRLSYTGLVVGLEHLKIKTRLTNEKFESVKGESLFVCLFGTGLVYYESMKRKLLKPIYECRCNGRLQTKRFTRLTHTGSVVELEHLKIKSLQT